MNPSLPADYLEPMKQDDPEAYRSEVLGEFRAGVSNFFDSDALDACVVPERLEVPPADGVQYRAFVDPSGGSRDAFTVAVAHHDGARVIVDCARAWSPPFNPSGAVVEIAALLRSYRVHVVTGDRYAGEWPAEQFRGCGILYRTAPLDRSALYLELLPLVNAGAVELPDDPKLLRELRALGFDEAARAVTVVGALNGVEVAELLAVGLRVEHGRLVPVALPRAAEHDAAFPRLRWAA